MLQSRQRTDHSGRTDQLGTGLIGTELTATAEPGHNGRGQNTQHNFRHDGRHIKGNAGAVAFVFQHRTVNKVTDDAGEEHHKGVYHALNQGQGNHIAVGNVADFMAQHGLNLIFIHALQQAGRHRDQRIVAVPAGGKSVGRCRAENTHFRHTNTGFIRQFFYRAQQPLFAGIMRAVDDLHVHGFLRHPLGQEQRHQRAGHTEHQTEHHQVGHIQLAALSVITAHAQQRQRNTGHQHHRQVSGQE